MVFLEVLFEGVVVAVVLRPRIPPVAEKAPLMSFPTVLVELVVVVESLAAESAERMTLEAGLVRRAWLIIATSHMLLQFLIGKELMLMSKNLLVPRAQIAHLLMVGATDVAVQIRPAEAGKVAGIVRTIIAEKENSIADDVFVRKFDTNILVPT